MTKLNENLLRSLFSQRSEMNPISKNFPNIFDNRDIYVVEKIVEFELLKEVEQTIKNNN